MPHGGCGVPLCIFPQRIADGKVDTAWVRNKCRKTEAKKHYS